MSHIFLLTDGENEHGNNQRCLKLAAVAAEYGITLNTFGFGDHWNQDILEKIADIAGGSLSYIERPEQALIEFTRLFNRLQSVRLTNAFLQLELDSRTHLAELKPIAQVAPETIEMSLQKEGHQGPPAQGNNVPQCHEKLVKKFDTNCAVCEMAEVIVLVIYSQLVL